MRTILILAILVLAIGLVGCTKEVPAEPDAPAPADDAGDAMEEPAETEGEATDTTDDTTDGDATESDDLFAKPRNSAKRASKSFTGRETDRDRTSSAARKPFHLSCKLLQR